MEGLITNEELKTNTEFDIKSDIATDDMIRWSWFIGVAVGCCLCAI